MRRAALVLAALIAAAGAVEVAAQEQDPGCAGVLLRASDGGIVPGADAVYGRRVGAVVPDGSGGWYVGGEFRRVGNAARSNLAHLDRNGRVDRRFVPRVAGAVRALALAGRMLYVSAGGKALGVDAVTGRATAWRPATRDVDEIQIVGDVAYLGTAGGVVAVDARTGTPRGGPANGRSPFAIAGMRAYVTVGRAYYGRVAAYELASGAEVAWPAAPRGYLTQVVAARGQILAAGRFATAGSRRIVAAAWSARSGELLWKIDAGTFPIANRIAVGGGRVYIGGLFAALDGEKRNRLGAVDLATGKVTHWQAKWNDPRRWTPLALAATPTHIFVGAAPTNAAPVCTR